MGEKVLVGSEVADAVDLVEELDARGLSPSLAAWYFHADVDDWRLLLAGPAFDELLAKQEAVAYGKVVEAMTQLSPASLSLSDVEVINTKAPLAQALHALVATPPTGVVRAHFMDTSLNGIFMKEVIVLRSSVDRAA